MPPFQLLDELVTPTVKPTLVFEAETRCALYSDLHKNRKNTKRAKYVSLFALLAIYKDTC